MNKENSELQNDIESLIDWLSKTHTIPPYDNIKVIIDLGNVIAGDSDIRVPINRKNILPTSDYADEYKNLKTIGLSWINLHCAGIYENSFVVVIECPKEMPTDAKEIMDLPMNRQETLCLTR